MPTKKVVSVFFVALVIGFMIASFARTIIFGIVILLLIAAAVWAVLQVKSWRTKVEDIFKDDKETT